MDLGPRIIFRISDTVFVTETVCWAVIVAVALIIFAFVSTRNLRRDPKGVQGVVELIVEYVYKFVNDTMGKHNIGFAPYIGTLFFFLLFCNMLGMLGWRAATADMNFTFAMGVLVFFIIQYNSIRSKGLGGYFKHFAEPFPFMVPIKIMEEITFPVSLSFRIFGNILAGVIIMELFMHLMGFVSESVMHLPLPLLQTVIPLPLNLFFDIFEPVLQAFVFSMLTMSFIAKAIVTHHED
ncbi:MAG: F0F1 ATP synthase subunit A [Clostridiales Family XIII bacterium]|nr:F0F1 ATP synthase subunit A [Clostridiales Family XIII bacterium]